MREKISKFISRIKSNKITKVYNSFKSGEKKLSSNQRFSTLKNPDQLQMGPSANSDSGVELNANDLNQNNDINNVSRPKFFGSLVSEYKGIFKNQETEKLIVPTIDTRFLKLCKISDKLCDQIFMKSNSEIQKNKLSEYNISILDPVWRISSFSKQLINRTKSKDICLQIEFTLSYQEKEEIENFDFMFTRPCSYRY